jgi:hypothetical protein
MSPNPEAAAAKSAGFAGLADLASNVDALLVKAQGGRPPPLPAPASIPTGPSFADAMEIREKQARRRKWLQPGIGIACYLVALCLIVFAHPFGKGPVRRQYSPSARSPQAATQPSPLYTPSPAGSAPADNNVDGTLEQVPPAGAGRALSFAELHWCLAQKERLAAARAAVHNNGPHAQVVRFNSLVDFYNARCGNFRFYKPDRERVESIVQVQKLFLDQQGRDLLNGTD